MGSAAQSKVLPCLFEAQLPIHGQADFRSVLVLLAVVLPPAHRAQSQRTGRLERPVSAARTSIAGGHGLHFHGLHFPVLRLKDGRIFGAPRLPPQSLPLMKDGLLSPLKLNEFPLLTRPSIQANRQYSAAEHPSAPRIHGVELPPRTDS